MKFCAYLALVAVANAAGDEPTPPNAEKCTKEE